ncbi:amidohydrolase [Acrasis kona]|uniref:Amidohydrolase n=1 Tax=Acrasis kona TaxID=1008807 RepID=A0AAW2ZBB7_9EUKA
MIDEDGNPIIQEKQKPNTILKYVVYALCGLLFVGVLVITTMATNRMMKSSPIDPSRGSNCKQLPPISTYKYDINPNRPAINLERAHLIKNGRTIINGTIIDNFSVLIGTNGKIISAGQNLVPNVDVFTMSEADGKFIMPGTVDCHSHLGVNGFPGLYGNDDVNEMTNPILPQVRAIDALDPEDFAIQQILESGVTTSLVLPGSSNAMGGEGVIVKNKPGTSNSEMLFPGAPMALKMACGENPKHYYKRLDIAPSSRMGSAWLMREKFQQAKDLVQQQDDFDCNAKSNDNRPENLELDTLSYLLRKHTNVTLHVHCYQTHDLEMMVRLSREFGFKIDTFQHALEAYKVPQLLLNNNISVSTFSDMFGFKTEAYDSSVNAPILLENAGVNVILKSDHPVLHAKWLLMSAAKSHYYGMTLQGSIDAITINPAKGLRLGHRVGALLPGYDADIVLYDRHPLRLGARPDKVYIDGKLLVDNKLPLRPDAAVASTSRNDPIQIQQGAGDECKTRTRYSSYAIKDALVYTMTTNGDKAASKATIVVRDGMVTCVDATCQVPSDAVVFSVTNDNGIVTPGLIEATTDIGLIDISAESDTYDGTSTTAINDDVRARDAIRMDSRTMRAAFKSGVTTVISRRSGDTLVNGWSVAYHTVGRVISESVIVDQVALHVNIGTSIKSSKGQYNSVSEQVSRLRKYFQSYKGDIPLIVAKCHQADDMDQLLSLKQQFNLKLIITGAAEAQIIADKLVDKNCSVIVTPIAEDESWLSTWDNRRSSYDFGAGVLHSKGVTLGIGIGNPAHDVRNLRWNAGLLSTDGFGSIPTVDALRSVTSGIADMFSLPDGVGRIKVGTRANFVLFDGNPLTFEGRPRLVAVGDTVECGDQLKQY